MSRFFQTSALTVGITKNGAITRTRAMPRPQNSWSSMTASRVPSPTVTMSTHPTRTMVFQIAAPSEGSVSRYL